MLNLFFPCISLWKMYGLATFESQAADMEGMPNPAPSPPHPHPPTPTPTPTPTFPSSGYNSAFLVNNCNLMLLHRCLSERKGRLPDSVLYTSLISHHRMYPQSTYFYQRWNRVSVSAHSAGAYTATWLVMVNVVKGVGVHPPPSPAWANFTLMMECTSESSRYYSVYSVDVPAC